jgi:hypothetical protein
MTAIEVFSVVTMLALAAGGPYDWFHVPVLDTPPRGP